MKTMKKSKFSTQYQPYLYDSCVAVKLAPRAISPFIQALASIAETRGLKEVVLVLKKRFASLVANKPDLFKMRDGLWIGVWRPIHRLSLNGRKGFRAALRLLKVYGFFIHPNPTSNDYRVLAADLSRPESSYGLLKTLYKQAEPVLLKGFDTNYPLGTTSVPMGPGVNKIEYLVTPEEHVKALLHCPRLVKRNYPLFKELVGDCLPTLSDFDKAILTSKVDYIGAVTLLTSDRGYKLRPVASAHRLIQHALSRLSNTIYSDLKTQLNCYVFDQDAGAVWVEAQLKNGHTVSSIDLSDASTNIPLVPLLDMMEILYPSLIQDIDLFATAQRCTWWTPFPGRYVKWERGTIQGVKGSFPGFTRFLIYLFNLQGIPSTDFCIVGDDLVFHSNWTDKALEVLAYYDIPVNYSKSLINRELSEFVGRVIDRHGSLEIYKGSPYSDNDPTGLLRQYGKTALNAPTLKNKPKRFGRVLQLAFDHFDDQALRKGMAFYSDRKSDIKTLLGGKDRPAELGGCPKELFKSMFQSTDPRDWDQEFFDTEMDYIGTNLTDNLQYTANEYLLGHVPVTVMERRQRPADFYTRVHTVGPDKPYQIYWGRPSYFIKSMKFPYNKEHLVDMAKFELKELKMEMANPEYIDFIVSGEILGWASKLKEVPQMDPLGLLVGKNIRPKKQEASPKVRPVIPTVERFAKAVSRSVLNYLVLRLAFTALQDDTRRPFPKSRLS